MKLVIEGMSCNHCKVRIERVLSEVDGVKKVEVNLAGGFVMVEASKDLPKEVLREAIDDAGYTLVKIEN